MANISGNETDQTLNGTPNDDVITGGAGSEVINGGAGNDTIDGGPGNDTIAGGDGNDTITGGTGTDSINGGAGNDVIRITEFDLPSVDTYTSSVPSADDSTTYRLYWGINRPFTVRGIDGGADVDEIRLDFSSLTSHTGFIFKGENLTNIEKVSVANYLAYPSLSFVLYADALREGVEWSLQAGSSSFNVIGDGGAVSLAGLQSPGYAPSGLKLVGPFSEVSFAGAVMDFGAVNTIVFDDFGASIPGIVFPDSGVTTIKVREDDGGSPKEFSGVSINFGTGGGNTLALETGTSETHERVFKGTVTGTTTDTITLSGKGVMDLTGLSLIGVDDLIVANEFQSVILTRAQADALTITGPEGFIPYIKELNGDISFASGPANDQIEGADLVTYSGARDEYTVTVDPMDPLSVRVDHVSPTGLDTGTDILNGVGRIQFADGTTELLQDSLLVITPDDLAAVAGTNVNQFASPDPNYPFNHYATTSWTRSYTIDNTNNQSVDTVVLALETLNYAAFFFNGDKLGGITSVAAPNNLNPDWNNYFIRADALRLGIDWYLDGHYNRLHIIGDGGAVDLSGFANDSYDPYQFNFYGSFSEVSFTGAKFDYSGIDVLQFTQNDEIPRLVYPESGGLDIKFPQKAISPNLQYNSPGDAMHEQALDIDFGMGGNNTLSLNFTGSSSRTESVKLWGQVTGTATDNLIFDVPAANSTVDYIDLTGLSLVGFNTLTITGDQQAFILTQAQVDSWNIVAAGNFTPFIKDPDGTINLSDGDDVFSGQWNETVVAGSGDDTISRVGVLELSGAKGSYTWERDVTDGRNVTLENSGGSDGTDTLRDVMELHYGDGSKDVLDDYVDELTSSVPTQLRELSYGESLTAAFQHSTDTDVFRLNIAPVSPFNFDMWTGGTRAYLYARDLEGNVLHWHNMTTNSKGSMLSTEGSTGTTDYMFMRKVGQNYEPFEGGPVDLMMMPGNWQGQTIQQYTFEINLSDDKTDTISTLGSIDSQTGEELGFIGVSDGHGAVSNSGSKLNDDKDWIATDLNQGTSYIIEVLGSGSGNGTLADPDIRIFHESNLSNPISVADVAGGAAGDERVQFTATQGGRYYIEVSDATGLYTGSYKVTQRSVDNVSADISTSGRLEFDGLGIASEQGEINATYDRDWFRVELKGGQAYQVEAKGSSTASGTLPDPLLEVRSAAGTLIQSESYGGIGANALINFQAPEDGYYFVAVGATGNSAMGTFEVSIKGLADDFAGSALTTTSIAIDSSQDGLVESLGDTDWFKVGLSEGQTYKLSVVPDTDSAFLDPIKDPYIAVRDVSGGLLAYNDDFDGTQDAVLFFTAPATGIYHLEARSAFKYDIGAYEVLVEAAPADDHPDDTPTDLAVGSTATAVLGVPGDTDRFAVDLEADKTYQFEAKGIGSSSGTLKDPELRLISPTGELLVVADDGGQGTDSLAYFKPTVTGTYQIEVSGGGQLGSVNVRVAETTIVLDEAGETPATAKIIPSEQIGQDIEGQLLTRGDADWYGFDLVAGQTYRAIASGIDTGGGTLDDPMLKVYSSTGTLLDSDDDSSWLRDAALNFTPTQSGRYYFEVSTTDTEETGSYRFRLRQPDDYGSVIDQATAINLDTVVTGGIQWADGRFGAKASMGQATPVGPSGEIVNDSITPVDRDEDWFKIDLAANETYTVTATPAATGGLGRAIIEVLDPTKILSVGRADGKEIDTGAASVAVKAASTGTYYIRVTDGSGGTGQYSLQVTQGDVTDEDYLGPVSMSFVSGEAAAAASIGLAGDSDEFVATLTGGSSYRLELVPGRDGTTAPLEQGLMRVYFTPTNVTAGDISNASQAVTTANTDLAEVTTLHTSINSLITANPTTDFVTLAQGAGYNVKTAAAAVIGRLDSSVIESVLYAAQIAQAAVVANAGADQAAEQTILNQMITANRALVDALEAGTSIDSLLDTAVGLIVGVDNSVLLAATEAAKTAQTDYVQYLDAQLSALQGETEIELTSDLKGIGRLSSGGFEPEYDGTLRVVVSSESGIDTGRYLVRIVDTTVVGGDEAPDTVAEYNQLGGPSVTLGDTVSGQVDSSSDRDLFSVSLSQGQRISAVVEGYDQSEGTLASPVLRLLNSSGQLVGSGFMDDTGVVGFDLTILNGGSYFLEVSGGNIDGNVGTYKLVTSIPTASVRTDDLPADASTTGTVEPGAIHSGTIDYVGDLDWVRADLEADTSYVIDLRGAGAARGSLQDGLLYLLDSDGNEVGFDLDAGPAGDSRIKFHSELAGTYYLAAGGQNGETGTFELRVRKLFTGEADPLASEQWYADSLGVNALNGEFTGAGVRVGVIDDGVEYHHPDLMNQIDYAYDYDAQFKTASGEHKYPPGIPPDAHGTPVAGIIAAEANNETGVVGLAPDSSIASFRVKWAQGHISDALSRQHLVDVSNNSWGAIKPFSDDFSTAAYMADYANIRYAVESGRGGLGTVFVFSAGNDRASGDNVNYHNYQNARETVTVAAVSPDDTVASFSTPGAAILTSAYGSGVLTTDRLGGLGYNKAGGGAGDYTNFSGTSAAAPEVSAIVALMLEANDQLGYRDVQEILAHSSRNPDTATWSVNAASNHNLGGYSFNNDMGFGIVDAFAAVRLAESWKDQRTSYNEAYASDRVYLSTPTVIPDTVNNDGVTTTFQIDGDITVEHVELGIDIRHGRLGDLVIEITSPSGTVSRVLDRPTVTEGRPYGLYGEYSDTPTHLVFDLSSVQFYGEDARGEWTVSVTDVRPEFQGTLHSLSLRVYGDGGNPDDQYVFTESFGDVATAVEVTDDGGDDWINASAVRSDSTVNLGAKTFTIDGRDGTIADWTRIENVVTGDGADTITGDSGVNKIEAGRGNDTVNASAGSDVIDGGAGTDTVHYTGSRDDYALAFNTTDRTVQVTHSYQAGGQTVTDIDTLSGVEVLVFDDAMLSLATDFGNQAPTVKTQILASPLLVGDDGNFQIDVPDDAFEDESGTGLSYAATLDDGSQIPTWMTIDPVTGQLSGEPPEGQTGRYKVLLKAIDEFGAEAEQTLEIVVGDNQSPTVDQAKVIQLQEDATSPTPLLINAPTDPENETITITVTGVPSGGLVRKGSGDEATLSLNDVITVSELTDLVFEPGLDFYGNGGVFSYTVTDAGGASSSSQISFLVDSVNDAPVFGVANGNYNIVYSGTEVVTDISVPVPTDVEDSITAVKVIGLPSYGTITVAGNPVNIGDVVPVSALGQVAHAIDLNVKGPIGDLVLEAVDSVGASTLWTANLFVNGQAGLSQGSSAGETLYGSLANDLIYGFGGDDIIVANQGNDTIFGGTGNDIILGGDGDDQIDGGSGADFIDGGDGSDTLRGGPGDDIYLVDSTDIVVETLTRGAGGFDTVRTSTSWTAGSGIEAVEALGTNHIDLSGNELNNVLVGNDGNNVLLGGEGIDVLVGADGNDTLDGGSGRDRMVGGLGDDIYYVNTSSDQVIEEGNSGTDQVFATVDYVLAANVENLVLVDSAGDIAGAGNGLNNTITGNSGNNLINGGGGDDTMIGGAGDDTYVVNSVGDSIVDSSGVDTVRSTIDYSLADGLENGRLLGFQDLSIEGNSAVNQLIGNMGDNMIDGLGGADLLTGGSGGDGFVASVNDGTYDTITDFTSGVDLMLVDAVAFGLFDMQTLTGFTKGGLDESDLAFIRADGGRDGNVDAQFIYDTRSQILSVDADGQGSGAAEAIFALAGSGVSINYDDVYVLI